MSRILAAATLAFSLTGGFAAAQTEVASFYKGKTLEMIVGYAPGSSNDIAARALARTIGKYLPGNPNVITRNMPGGGSFVAANYIFNVAPKDGTVLGLMAPTIAIDEKLGSDGVKFKTAQFNWIGRETTSVGATIVNSTTKINTIEDARSIEVTMAATGAGSTTAIYPNLLNNMVGLKFKIVMGYVGSNEALLAMERGEVDGHSTAWEQVTSQHPDLQNVPLATDLVKTEREKRVMSAVVAAADVGKSILTSPGVPAERVAALRAAFDQAVKDPDFVSDFQSSRIEVIPMKGVDLQKMIEDLGALPSDLVEDVRKVYVMPGAK